MRAGAVRDRMRRGIAEESVKVLRRHGKSKEEIRSVIEKDFRIDKGALDEILDADGE